MDRTFWIIKITSNRVPTELPQQLGMEGLYNFTLAREPLLEGGSSYCCAKALTKHGYIVTEEIQTREDLLQSEGGPLVKDTKVRVIDKESKHFNCTGTIFRAFGSTLTSPRYGVLLDKDPMNEQFFGHGQLILKEDT